MTVRAAAESHDILRRLGVPEPLVVWQSGTGSAGMGCDHSPVARRDR